MEGKQYLGYTRRDGTVHHNTIREPRKLGPTCQSRNCARSKNRFCICICSTLTMDLQAVKVSPNVNASAIFFKTKLCCYNFTVFNLESHEVVCYWFTEVDSDLQASTFTSIVLEHLEKYCVSKKVPIVIYSDGCTYQNRNNILANALLNFSMKHDVEIFQIFLERGHTQMECDSVHALIERKLKGKDIYLPTDYVRATMEARKKPILYETRVLKRVFLKTCGKERHDISLD